MELSPEDELPGGVGQKDTSGSMGFLETASKNTRSCSLPSVATTSWTRARCVSTAWSKPPSWQRMRWRPTSHLVTTSPGAYTLPTFPKKGLSKPGDALYGKGLFVPALLAFSSHFSPWKFGFKKWKSHVTARPWEDRSEIVRDLYDDLHAIRSPPGCAVTCGNVFYVLLFGWWLSLVYLLVSVLMFLTILATPYGKLCWHLAGYLLWPFDKVIQKKHFSHRLCKDASNCDSELETSPLLSHLDGPLRAHKVYSNHPKYSHWLRVSTYIWLFLGYPVLVIIHRLICCFSWLLVFIIPIAKMNARMAARILLADPEQVHVQEIKGLCMVIGGLHHPEQRFNNRSVGVSSALLFLSVGGVFAPTLFSKVYGRLICVECQNITQDLSGSYLCHSCRFGLMENNGTLYYSHVRPLVYTVSLLLPAAYLVGLFFTLKTHSHIYDTHISDYPLPGHHHGAMVHWPRWRALLLLLLSTLCMSLCADLTTEHISPILESSTVSQYFIGVTVLAMMPELPEIVNGIQFALQNHLSLSIEISSCIAVQVCMLQIPILVLFSIFYPTGFMLFFSDLHVYASMFSVILMNYIFMDGKCDYFQGTVLVMVYFLLLAVYFFAPSPAGC
ncbi:LOW QUALITY PROTEIN: uncharacterized protein LOC110219212 [Phascolarctos cinereus]